MKNLKKQNRLAFYDYPLLQWCRLTQNWFMQMILIWRPVRGESSEDRDLAQRQRISPACVRTSV